MMSANPHKLDIALVGFNDRERLLMNSLFKVSGTYREWQEDSKAQPDYVLMDVDAETGRACADRELEHPSGSPIVAVGAEVTGKSIAAYIPRPFRWADVLNTLANVSRSVHPSTDREAGAKPVERKPLVDIFSGNGIPDAPAALIDELAGDSSHISISDLPDAGEKPRIYKTVGAVLVVNPNPKGWRHVSAEVANLGYRVDHVSTGAAAALLLANFRYNCVIVETQLPDQEGFDLCKLLRKTQGRRRTATIVLTTSSNPIDRIKSKYVGCDAFISKPIDREELARTLKRFLPAYTLQK
ncbi:MAG: two-component system, cell cycle response regulator [Burkholderiales bacterium]|jgi:twitching motility two-component system response regulator PilG